MTATSKPLDLASFEGHTQGPWEARKKPDDARVYDAQGAWIATTGDMPHARLIAAAPALLAECKRQRDVIAECVSCRKAESMVLHARITRLRIALGELEKRCSDPAMAVALALEAAGNGGMIEPLVREARAALGDK